MRNFIYLDVKLFCISLAIYLLSLCLFSSCSASPWSSIWAHLLSTSISSSSCAHLSLHTSEHNLLYTFLSTSFFTSWAYLPDHIYLTKRQTPSIWSCLASTCFCSCSVLHIHLSRENLPSICHICHLFSFHILFFTSGQESLPSTCLHCFCFLCSVSALHIYCSQACHLSDHIYSFFLCFYLALHIYFSKREHHLSDHICFCFLCSCSVLNI